MKRIAIAGLLFFGILFGRAKAADQIPANVSYDDDVAARSMVTLTDVHLTPATQPGQFGLEYTINNNSPRTLSAMVLQLGAERPQDHKASLNGTSAKDMWIGGNEMPPGSHRVTAGGASFGVRPNTTSYRVHLAFVEFSDGDRIGTESMISINRAWIRQGYLRMIHAHDHGTPDAELLDLAKPDPNMDPDRAFLTRAVSQYQQFVSWAEAAGGVAALVERGREIVADQRMIGVEDRAEKAITAELEKMKSSPRRK